MMMKNFITLLAILLLCTTCTVKKADMTYLYQWDSTKLVPPVVSYALDFDSVSESSTCKDYQGSMVLPERLKMYMGYYEGSEPKVGTNTGAVVVTKSSRIILPERLQMYESVQEMKHNVAVSSVAPVVEGAIEGKYAYTVPDSMVVGKSYVVVLRVNNGRLDIKTSDIKVKSTVKSGTVEVGNRMSANLIDGSGGVKFRITSLNNSTEQNIRDRYTEWSWSVTPLKNGPNQLRLVMTIKDEVDVVVFDKIIYTSGGTIVATGNFFADNWQWFLSTLVIPLVIFLYRRKKS